MSKIIMATTPTCTLCPRYAARLEKHGVPFEAVSIADSPELQELLARLGYMQAPVFLRLDHDAADDAPHFDGMPVAEHTSAYDKNLLVDWAGELMAA